jgi:protein TonB
MQTNNVHQSSPGINQQRIAHTVRLAIANNFYYPAMARRRGQQGYVRLAMRIEADGYLSNMRVVQSSGYGLLDNAAIKTLQRVDRVPEAVTWLDGHYLDMILPIEYRLE